MSISGLFAGGDGSAGRSGRHLLCLEVNPPRGTDVDAVLARCQSAEGVDFFNVTDSALARMKLSGLAFGAILKQRLGVEPVVNLRVVIVMLSLYRPIYWGRGRWVCAQ